MSSPTRLPGGYEMAIWKRDPQCSQHGAALFSPAANLRAALAVHRAMRRGDVEHHEDHASGVHYRG